MASGGHITFSGTSSFYSLNATAASGISVNANIASTIGSLILDGNYDVAGASTTSLSAGVALSAKTDLLLHSRASGFVAVSGSGSWSAQQDVKLYSGVRISGSGSTLSIQADSDGSGSGILYFASTANITVDSSTYSGIYLRYDDVQWSSGLELSASSASVIFDKSRLGSASFGGSGTVSNAELQMVTTSGVIQLGDVYSTAIAIQGLDRSLSSEALVLIKASSSVAFDTGSSTFKNDLDVRSQGSVTFSQNVTVHSGYAYFMADSDGTGRLVCGVRCQELERAVVQPVGQDCRRRHRPGIGVRPEAVVVATFTGCDWFAWVPHRRVEHDRGLVR